MKFSKLLLAVVGATVLLGALVASASAAHLENSSQTNSATWTRMNFTGSLFGTVECEVVLSGSFHSRTISKVEGALIGYINRATVTRCARGGATVNQSSLPWHRRYKAFAGTLPNITGVEETVTGAEWTIREPLGFTCTVRREKSSTTGVYRVSSGVVTEASVTGTSSCENERTTTTGTLEGRTERVEDGSGTGARLTIRLI